MFMPPKTPSRLLLPVLFIFIHHCCIAGIIRVNINNPSSGNGSSWALACNNLQAALTAANPGDEIWVVAGTYKPTATTDRTISFNIHKNGLKVYGGFNGTETIQSERNWKINKTILSGDIGIIGDASDNSYNVVSIQSTATSALLDGFSVQSGNADPGSPNKTPLPYNQGGGVIIKAVNNSITNAEINHCTFSQNFGVYGGGICSYTEGNGAVCQVNVFNSTLDNNSGLIGGGVAVASYSGGNAYIYMQNCILNNNSSIRNAGSAVGGEASGTLSSANIDVINCTLYNNPVPVLFNLIFGTSKSYMDVVNCIIWKDGAPYPGILSGLGFIDYSALYQTWTNPSNIIDDPLFVDAANNDFRIKACSPVIDKGNNSRVRSPSDFEGSSRFKGTAVDIGAYEPDLTPALPVAATVNYCQYTTASALTAKGDNLLWYTDAITGAGSPTAPVPSTAIAGTTIWYVSQQDAVSCSRSVRVPLNVVVHATPAAPVVSPIGYCLSSSSLPLSAAGSNLLWYTAATGGTGSTVAPIPATTAAGTITWYVSQTNTQQCESPRAQFDVTVYPLPAVPGIVSPVSYCQYAITSPLQATGTNLQWYAQATGGVATVAAPTPVSTTPGIVYYYVTQTDAHRCESDRLIIPVTILSNPKPDFDIRDACIGNNAVVQLSALNPVPDTYNWNFHQATMVTGSGAGPYEVNWSQAGTYPISLTTTTGACSNSVQHSVNIFPQPAVFITPVTTSLCIGDYVTLRANGADTYTWTPGTNGLYPLSGNSPTLLLVQDETYFVTGTDANGCSSTASITIKGYNGNCREYYFPNAFTPDANGRNDAFRIKTYDTPRSFDMRIFNRWGQEIFHSKNISKGWDGMLNGHPAPAGSYIYVVNVITSAGAPLQRKGNIVLIR